MAMLRKSLEPIRRESGGEVDHEFLDSLTDDDIERIAEADAEEHGYRLESYEWIVRNGRMVYPDDGNELGAAKPGQDNASGS